MVIVKIHAGLGNQMFQYATGRSLALQKHTGLFLDTAGYETDTFRKYELGRFNIFAKFLPKDWRAREARLKSGRRYIPLRLFLRAIQSPLVSKRIVVADIEKGFDDRVAKIKGNLYLDGYWQSELYFRGIRELLLKEFTFKDAPNPENARRRIRPAV